MSSFVLIHSPVLGPSSWARAADTLRERGHDVLVPDLTDVVDVEGPGVPWFTERAAAAAASLDGPLAIAGHSGAGAYLPGVASQLAASDVTLVFVDAVVPPETGAHRTAPGLARVLDEQTIDGRVRRWLEWYPEDVVTGLLPDAADRAFLLEDMPSVPRSLYDEPVPVPDGWRDGRNVYLRISEGYAAQHAQAAELGWRNLVLDLDHIAIHTSPVAVVDGMLSLLGDA